MRLADREDPRVHDTLGWWNEYVVYWFCTEGTECSCKRVCGNEWGKVTIGDLVEEELEKW
jgi:hypothetical protein